MDVWKSIRRGGYFIILSIESVQMPNWQIGGQTRGERSKLRSDLDVLSLKIPGP